MRRSCATPQKTLPLMPLIAVICANQEMHRSFDYALKSPSADRQHTGAPLTMTPYEGQEMVVAHARQEHRAIG
jgi:hypothetical protein